MSLLQVKNLEMHFPVHQGILFPKRVGTIRAVDGITFDIAAGRTLGLVGESGSGKSTAARAILQLYRPTAGEVLFESTDLTKLSTKSLRPMRRHFQMVFQDPYSTLNPRMTIGQTLSEPVRVHGLAPKSEVGNRIQQLLEQVGLNPNAQDRYPHEFSGGQRQRIAIARALACEPKLIVCDEPVSSLDVSIRAQIMNLLEELRNRFNLAYLFISHELSMVRHIADDVAVMYLGKIVEIGPKKRIFENPLHPYTQLLLASAPIADPQIEKARTRVQVPGEIPSPANPPSGCAFHPRCPIAVDRCKTETPRLETKATGHLAACHLVETKRS